MGTPDLVKSNKSEEDGTMGIKAGGTLIYERSSINQPLFSGIGI